MKITDTKLHDVKIISFDNKEDARGVTELTLNDDEMNKRGLSFHCKEQRIYHAPRKGTFYGIHFQTKDYPQTKLIYLLCGRGIDYIIDLKKDSPTYKEWVAIELYGGDNQHIYIPQGYGHAFLTLEDNTTQLFSVNEHFYENSSKQLRFDDTQINLSLPIEIEVMADYDRTAPYLDEIDYEL